MSSSQTWYVVLLVLVALERVLELVVSTRNSRRAKARGGVETGQGHYPAMVALHTGLLLGCLLEVVIADRPFLPWLGWPMLGLVIASQALRWWCIATLGERWNTRVIVVPGLPLVTSGPYRWFRHPNYVAVVVEGFALPLVHTAWITAVLFTALNIPLLAVRLRCEEAALATAAATTAAAATDPATTDPAADQR
jgi:methyltransferase